MAPRRLAPLLLALFAGCGGPAADGPAPPLEVYAAASTREPIERLAADFQTEAGVRVSCSFEASSTLARQVEQVAPADLFLSADREWADYLAGKHLVAQRRDLLANRLVVVVPADSKAKFASVADVADEGVRRLAVAAEPVPAGRYAREALRKAGVWDRVKDSLVEGGNVRAALRYVEQGEADAGFVYATDAKVSRKARVAFEVPADLTGPVVYPLVTLRRDRPHPAAARFADYLAGDHAADVFRDAGFRPLR